MRVKDLLHTNVMILSLKATDKLGVIEEMVNKLAEENVISDAETYKEGILKREAQTSTGLGDGIAMPHAKNEAVKDTTVLFAKSEKGVDYDALDGQPVQLFFMIAAPAGANNAHLQALATLSGLLIDPTLVANLKKAQSPEEVLNLLESAEEAKEAKEAKEEAEEVVEVASNTDEPYLVAVTACITGIAHTYMAEAALKEAAEKMGVKIKVETNGAVGIKHRLTTEDIERAEGVIIAADKKVEMARFDGKQLTNHPVKDGIKKPEELIQTILDNKAPQYHAQGEDLSNSNVESEEGVSIGQQAYTSLMNGVSNMLPFVVAGGILMALSFAIENFVGAESQTFLFLNGIGSWAFSFLNPVLAAYIAEAIGDRPALMPGFVGGYMASVATATFTKTESPAGFLGALVAGFIAGFVVLLSKRMFRHLPKTLDGLKTIFIYPIVSLFLTGLAMYLVVDPIFGLINTVITNFLNNMGTANAVLLGGLLGGMMAVDMGGPVNKAAYVFSIGTFSATQNGNLMAAVMIGGMIPPIAIALSTSIVKNKWTEEERTSAISNYILGLSFITEGAIPFAAKDPVHIIGSSIVGSVIGGALSQLWKVSVPAPHGGIFAALFLSNNLIGFLSALIIGSLISALILSAWKPSRPMDEKVEAAN